MTKLPVSRCQLTAAAVFVVAVFGAPPTVASDEATRAPDALEFAIDGVGKATFDTAVVAGDPGQNDAHRGHLCLTLQGGSRSNSPELLKWVGSNSAGAALATRPAATLTVPKGHAGLQEGTYHLNGVTVSKFTQKTDRDLTHARLAGALVNCESMDAPTPAT